MNRSFILIIPFLLGCSPNSSGLKIEKKIQAYIAQNFEQYESIHQILIEEIEQGKKKFLYATMGQLYREYKVDNLIVFNEDNTKLFTTVNTIKDDGSSGSSDKIQSLYGVKIDGRWYVYLGKYNLVALRAGYKYDKYEPFTWEELSYVAHEQMFRRYISLDRKGNLVIDYEQLEADVNPEHMCGTNYINEPTIEQGLIKCYENKMSKIIDSTHLAQIYADIEAGKDKEREPVQKPGWVQRKLGIGVPIFESKAWKKHLEERRRE
jgi:hypothetical protein